MEFEISCQYEETILSAIYIYTILWQLNAINPKPSTATATQGFWLGGIENLGFVSVEVQAKTLNRTGSALKNERDEV